MLRKTLSLLFVVGFAFKGSGRRVAALPIGPGGGGNFACDYCEHVGGWIPGPFHLIRCASARNGVGSDCEVQDDQCVFRSGCVSLPDAVSPVGIAL